MKDSIHIVVPFAFHERPGIKWLARLPTGPLYYVLKPVISPMVSKMNSY